MTQARAFSSVFGGQEGSTRQSTIGDYTVIDHEYDAIVVGENIHIYLKRGLSILMVSHDLHLVMASTKKVLCLSNHICCIGKPQQITKDPEFISMFGKDMANIMAVYQHSNETEKVQHNNTITGE